MVPSCDMKMEDMAAVPPRKERNFSSLDLTDQTNLSMTNQPILVIQSPKTPTLSRKLKAVSLDSDPPKSESCVELARDVSSMPNTPKKQPKPRNSLDFDDNHKPLLGVSLGSNLKRFASNTSISGSQTLKTLPEVMTLQDFSDNKPEPVKIKAKGLLERRGSNASLTIDLGSNSSIAEVKSRLNTTKSASHLNLTMVLDKCSCTKGYESQTGIRRFSRHQGESCSPFEGVPTRSGSCRNRCYTFHKKCNCLCNFKCRRKSLSNENLYVPPCNFCTSRLPKDGRVGSRTCKGCRRAVYPRQPEMDSSQLLSEDFKLHLQNIQYLQTAGNVLSVADLKASCEPHRVPKLHQEFWEVPLNLQEKCLVSGSQNKNRYKGVLPNEHSRVHLLGPQSYIHANYIKVKGPDYTETAYIATQGPMEHTCEDFWEMVWISECNYIVMLTGLMEKGKSKCELYFPLGKSNSVVKSYMYVTTTKPRDRFTFDIKNTQQYEEETVAYEEKNELEFGSYKISYHQRESLGECVIRKLRLEKKNESVSREISHYWFSNWQDHKMANPEQVLQIALHILQRMDPKVDNKDFFKAEHSECKFDRTNHGRSKCNFPHKIYEAPKSPRRTKITHTPVVVHCSAGIGRTGCFLAILNGIQQLRNNRNVDVLAILCSLRLSRGGMVQTAEQYELIHRVLSLYTGQM